MDSIQTSPIDRFKQTISQSDFWVRLGLCSLAIVIMWAATGAWNPPFPYEIGYTPSRDISARVEFEFENDTDTNSARAKARGEALYYYSNDVSILDDLRGAALDKVIQIQNVDDYSELEPGVWDEFLAVQDDAILDDSAKEIEKENAFNQFRKALAKDVKREKFKQALEFALLDFRNKGLLVNLEHAFGEGDMQRIMTFPENNISDAKMVNVEEVRIGEIEEELRNRLTEEFTKESGTFTNPKLVADHMYNWIRFHLPSTLSLDPQQTDLSKDRAAESVKPLMTKFRKGDKLTYRRDDFTPGGVEGGKAIDESDLQILRAEHDAYAIARDSFTVGAHIISDFGLFSACFLLAGSYLLYRRPEAIEDLNIFCLMLASIVVTVCVASFASFWRAEVIPLVIFSATVSIAYRHELAWILSASVSLIIAFSLGYDLSGFVILIAAATAVEIFTGNISTRTRFVGIGIGSALVVFLTTISAEVLGGQPFNSGVIKEAGWFAGYVFVACLLMTPILPFAEKIFGFHTDISLLELGDASHPLLQELFRRAPGTYNHSMNVASIAEAASDAIGADGLLCRVAAYFHDIGKMRKPEYFIENQSEENKHDQLQPAMSALVIIAHVKDGVELARQHGLPQTIIDFIEQHHGTTLVKYFFDQAQRRREVDEENDEAIDESTFRYPGPKPQTKEACVMMLADTLESASRSLSDPAPARIESLVHELVLKRLLAGQFQECDITLSELQTIEESLIKSLTAVFHSRIKYPNQENAKVS